MCRILLSMLLASAAAAWVAPPALAGPVDKVKRAVDPDCTPEKAAKGAAMKATVGVGNRCGVAETVRDATGTDGNGKRKRE